MISVKICTDFDKHVLLLDGAPKTTPQWCEFHNCGKFNISYKYYNLTTLINNLITFLFIISKCQS